MRNLWSYGERRWSDVEANTKFDVLRRGVLAWWPFVASLAAMAVVVAAGFAVWSTADQRDDVLRIAEDQASAARSAASAARRAHRTAEDIRTIAAENRSISQQIQAFLAVQAPCDDGSPADSPACQRAARTQAAIDDALGRINQALASTIARHDLNVHDGLADLLALLRAGSAAELPRPGPVTAVPVPPAPAAAAAAASPSTTSTTTTTTTIGAIGAPPDSAPAARSPQRDDDPVCHGQGRGRGRCR